MRSQHDDAGAPDGRGSSRLTRLLVLTWLGLVSGCGPSIGVGIQHRLAYSQVLRSGQPAAESIGPGTGAFTVAASAPPAAVGTPPAGSSSTPAPTADRKVLVASARAAEASQPGQTPPPGAADPNAARNLRELDPTTATPVPAPPAIPPPSGEYPIDLATALRLADVANPTIGKARSVVLEALAQQLTARTLLVPSLNGGVNYHGHNGVLQRPSGNMLLVSEQSLYIGAGSYAYGSGTVTIPGVTILTPLTDAWFEPLAARQRVAASRFLVKATENEILMEVAVLHLELIRHFTLLEAHRLSESQAYQIVQAIGQYAVTGQGRQADYDRAKAEWRYRRADVIKAEEGMAIAVARLAQRLNLDPSVRLEPAGGPVVPLHLIDIDTPPEMLIQTALRQRPDLAARGAEIGEAEAHVRQEIGRPFLPTLWLGFSGGAYGGGSNLTPPLVGNFGGRTDFDVRLYWTLSNLGAGNVALIHQRQAQVGVAVAEQARTINRARDEVIAALADAKAARNQIEVARRELVSSHEGFHEDLTRSRDNLGRPIEVINSLNLLAGSRANLIDALIHYDQAQFRLWIALGSPPPLVETSSPGQPPVPDYLKP
jgi:outer membrane protein TolC